jgi:hypothetical protein
MSEISPKDEAAEAISLPNEDNCVVNVSDEKSVVVLLK